MTVTAMAYGIKNCILILMLCGICAAGYPKGCFVNFYTKPGPSKLMAGHVLAECRKTDFRNSDAFEDLLRRIVRQHNNLMDVFANNSSSNRGSAKPTMFPQPPTMNRVTRRTTASGPGPIGNGSQRTTPVRGSASGMPTTGGQRIVDAGNRTTPPVANGVTWGTTPSGPRWTDTGDTAETPVGDSVSGMPTTGGQQMGGSGNRTTRPTTQSVTQTTTQDGNLWKNTSAMGKRPTTQSVTQTTTQDGNLWKTTSAMGKRPTTQSVTQKATHGGNMWKTTAGMDKPMTTPTWMRYPLKQMNITTFLMLMYQLTMEKPFAGGLKDCVRRSGSSELAWRALQTHLNTSPALEFHFLLQGSMPFLNRAKARDFEKLPASKNITRVEAIMKILRTVHCSLSSEVRTSIFNWAKKSLMSSQCPKRENADDREDKDKDKDEDKDKDKDEDKADCDATLLNDANLDILGAYVTCAPARYFNRLTPQKFCERFRDMEFAKGVTCMFDIQPSRARKILSMLNVTCIDLNDPSDIKRLGALSCFFEDVDSLNNNSTNALFSKLKLCQNEGARQKVGSLVKKSLSGRVPNKEDLKNFGAAVSRLSHKVLKSIKGADLRVSIQYLGKDKGSKWGRPQAQQLVDRFMEAGGRIENLTEFGSLVTGFPSKILSNLTAEQVQEAFENGSLGEQADQFSSLQKTSMVVSLLRSKDTLKVIKSIRSSLIQDVPLDYIGKNISNNLTEVSDLPWNEEQALVIISGTVSLTIIELGQLGALIQGVTCEMIEKYSDQFGLNLSRTLENEITQLSRKQLTCAADKLKKFLESLTPDYLQENLDFILDKIPSDILLYLGKEYTCGRFAKACGTFLEKMDDVRLELLPRSSPVRGCVRDAAVRCLNKDVSSLDDADVGKLGMLVCEFTDRNITDLPDSVFAALVTTLGRCQQFHSTARESLNSKLLKTFGPVSGWTEDTVTSLGSMITLLSEDSLSGLPNMTFVKEALQKYCASQASAGAPASPEFGDACANLVQSQTKIFIIVVGVESAAESASARAAVCSVIPNVEQIQGLGEANTLWSVQQLGCMTADTFEDTVDVLATVQGFSYEQCAALMEKAKEAWGPALGFDQYQLSYLRSLLSVLPVSELKLLDFRSIDTLESMAASSSWTQEKRAAVLERYLQLNNITTADLDTIQFSGLGNFICGMTAAQINQLQNDAVRNSAKSFGKLSCPPSVLDLLKGKMTVVFGPMDKWSAAQMSQLGTVAAGASSEDLKSLPPSVMPYVSSTAVACIPTERFQVLSASQLQNLGPENAAAVTTAQFEALSEEQQSAVNEALGVPDKVAKFIAMSHSPSPSRFGLIHVAHTLLVILLLVA